MRFRLVGKLMVHQRRVVVGLLVRDSSLVGALLTLT